MSSATAFANMQNHKNLLNIHVLFAGLAVAAIIQDPALFKNPNLKLE